MNRIGPQLDARRPRVVSFGGGKGGVGRSTVCAEMARSLAHRGDRILCVDASWSCPTLNTLLHAEEPRYGFGDDQQPLGSGASHIADFIEQTGVDDVWWVSLAAGRDAPFARPRLEPLRLIEQLHDLEFDWIFLDLPPGLDPLDVGLFVLSDIPLLIATPEPSAVRVATQFLRSAMVEAIRVHPSASQYPDGLDRLLAGQSLDVSAASLRAAADPPLEELVDEALERLEPYLVVNLVREGAEQDLGFVICHAWYQALSMFPRFLTSVDYENRRWFYHRRTTGRDAVRGDETLSRDIEKLSDMASEISAVDAKYPRPIPEGDEVHPALRLGISPDSSRNDVRQHCRRLWEGYKRERAIDVIFSDTETRTDIASELESLYRKVLTLPSDTFDTVSDLDQPPGTAVGLSASSSSTPSAEPAAGLRESSGPGRGAASDVSGEHDAVDAEADVDSEPHAEDPGASDDPEPGDRREDRESEVAETHDGELPDVGPPDDSEPGQVIEQLRRRSSLSLQELSRRTNIGVKYLTGVEDADIDVLPRPVYLREYLRKMARVFEVDPDALVDAYLERLDDPSV